MKRLLSFRRLYLILSLLTVVVCAGILIENWTGERALAAAKLRLAQAGETLDFAALLPMPIPDEVNFCALPPLAGITLEYQEGDTGAAATVHQNLRALDWFRLPQGSPGAMRFIPNDPSSPSSTGPSRKPPPTLTNGCTLAQPLDVDKAAGYLREAAYIDTATGASPADVLASLDRLHPILKELSDAAPGRPEARLIPDIARGREATAFLGSRAYLMPLNYLAKALALRSQVAAAAGDPENALRSLLAIRRLVQATEGDPTLIGLIVSGGVVGHELNSIWALLRSRTADESLLALLQRELERQDTFGQALQAARGELVFQITSIEWCRDQPEERIKIVSRGASLETLGYGASWWEKMLARSIPTGWFDHNAAITIQLHATYVREPWIKDDGAAIMRGFNDLDTLLGKGRGLSSPHHMLPAMSMPSFWAVLRGFIYSEAVRRQALIAIALERHRLSHGKLPTHLADLVPAFLGAVPEDPMHKQPMRYRVEDDNTFTLWSIGFDQRNDHGALPEEKTARRITMPDYRGDWVWQSR